MAWTANLIQCLDQGILVLGLEGNAEVDRCVVRWMTQVLPVAREGIPKVFDTHVAPMRCTSRREACDSRG
jgi:hypothetical protein